MKSSQSGIFLLNKPKGMSSNAVLQRVKRLFGVKKAGHTGSLDPLATGMLPICLGEATKFSQFLLNANKCYEAVGLLGLKTDTSDAMGKIIASAGAFAITQIQMESTLAHYRGVTHQIPSMYSALKHQGTPLYRLAREGKVVERPAREIVIEKLELQQFDGVQFGLIVQCSKGTYIRNLVEDLGDDLGVGAHVVALHRVYVGGFEDCPMWTLEDLEAMDETARLSTVLPMDKAVAHFAVCTISDENSTLLRNGCSTQGAHAFEEEKLVRLYGTQGQFLGLGLTGPAGGLKAKRLLAY